LLFIQGFCYFIAISTFFYSALASSEGVEASSAAASAEFVFAGEGFQRCCARFAEAKAKA